MGGASYTVRRVAVFWWFLMLFSLGFLLVDLILVCRRHGRWLWWSSQEAASESDAVCLVCGVGTRYGWYVVSNR